MHIFHELFSKTLCKMCFGIELPRFEKNYNQTHITTTYLE